MSADELLARVVTFGHGTTQATNALIERTGAATGLITTRGFGDTIGLQRLMGFTAAMTVDELGWYSKRRYPEPVVPRALRREVPERVDYAGTRASAARRGGGQDRGRKSCPNSASRPSPSSFCGRSAIPAHEQRVGEIVREMRPEAYVSLSSRAGADHRRVRADGDHRPQQLSRAARRRPISTAWRDCCGRAASTEPSISSTRRRGDAGAARRRASPVLLLTSGPTGGVLGSLQLAKALGHDNVITTDMGGTSFDVGLIVDGKPLVSGTHEAGGYHLNTPMIDIRAIGAGGGSIARVERRPAAGRPGERRRGARARSATGAAARGRPSPTPTSSSASSTPTTSSAAHERSTAKRRRRRSGARSPSRSASPSRRPPPASARWSTPTWPTRCAR